MEKKVYKCLIASPNDTAIERKLCEKVFDELNKGIGDKFGFVIEKRMWEHNTRPSVGEYSQAVVSEQLGHDYDIPPCPGSGSNLLRTNHNLFLTYIKGMFSC